MERRTSLSRRLIRALGSPANYWALIEFRVLIGPHTPDKLLSGAGGLSRRVARGVKVHLYATTTYGFKPVRGDKLCVFPLDFRNGENR
jgi:hypothetical protein